MSVLDFISSSGIYFFWANPKENFLPLILVVGGEEEKFSLLLFFTLHFRGDDTSGVPIGSIRYLEIGYYDFRQNRALLWLQKFLTSSVVTVKMNFCFKLLGAIAGSSK